MAKGVLYLVGVPIGNYDDMTMRALNTLKAADVLLVEDTRKAKHLLKHFEMTPKRMVTHHAHNEHEGAKGLLTWLEEGQNLALITDAGMPSVSDPGFMAAKTALDAGYEVVPIPGVSASLTALVASGLPTETFTFCGFLPRADGEKQRYLERLATATETLIFYASPRRVVGDMQAIRAVLGNRPICAGRELTKIHEEYMRGSVEDVLQTLQSRNEVLGEFTLVVEGAAKTAATDWQAVDMAIDTLHGEGLRAKEIRNQIVEAYNLPKRDAYQRVLTRTKKS